MLVGLVCGFRGASLPAGLIFVAAAIYWITRRTSWALLMLAVLGLLAGVWRGNVTFLANKKLTQLAGQTVAVQGEVADDPAVSDKNYVQFTLTTPSGDAIPVRTYFVEMQRGYQVSVEGKLEAGYGGKPVQFGFASVKIVSRQQSWLERIRQRFIAGTRTVLPEPLAGFALGLLVGARSLIPKDLQNTLALVGLSHLVAVSGYNLTILVEASRKILGRFSRYVQLALPLWLIGGFAVVTGFSPSIVRAAIVSGLTLVAAHYGRRIKPMVLILLAAAATAAWQPNYLADLGWQLSFGAFFGILVVAPLVQMKLGKFNWAFSTASESLSAQVMTFPIILLAFGTLSLVAPLSNVLILPVVPLAMLLAFMAGLIGMLAPAAAFLVWPAWAVLNAMLAVINWLAGLRWSSINAQVTFTAIASFYGALIIMVMARYIRLQNGIISKETNSKLGLEKLSE